MKVSLALASLAVLSISVSHADSRISLITDQQPVEILVKGPHVKIRSIDSAFPQSVEAFFDTSQRVLTIVDHQKQTVLPINAQTIQRIGGTINAAIGAVQSLPDENQRQVEQMMRLLGLSLPDTETPALKLVDAKPSQRSGFECQQQTVMEGERALAKICTSNASALGLSEQDYSTLIIAQNFILDAASQAQQLAEQYGQKIPDFGELELSGLLIFSHQLLAYDEQAEREIKASFVINSINHETIEAIAYPDNYTIRTMP